MDFSSRAQPIQLLLTDVDGVLTDGGIIFDNQGIETKQFHIQDGLGIKLWQRAGLRFGMITGRSSHIVKLRAAELGVDLVRQGFETKLPTVKEVARELGLKPEQIAYIGDDLPDLPVLRWAGLAVAVADAVPEVLAAAHLVTQRLGGRGAVREAIAAILQAQQRWQEVIMNYEL
jgi:3-deoxy-D-manno-octulosonate 8-phosphate phosphatase (KDO 8-P phosphatase)